MWHMRLLLLANRASHSEHFIDSDSGPELRDFWIYERKDTFVAYLDSHSTNQQSGDIKDQG